MYSRASLASCRKGEASVNSGEQINLFALPDHNYKSSNIGYGMNIFPISVDSSFGRWNWRHPSANSENIRI
jgi:hypothetical protein